MSKVKKEIMDRLNEAGLFRGCRCGNKPAHMYFEKQTDGSFRMINAGSAKQAFEYKRWKWEEVDTAKKPKTQAAEPVKL